MTAIDWLAGTAVGHSVVQEAMAEWLASVDWLASSAVERWFATIWSKDYGWSVSIYFLLSWYFSGEWGCGHSMVQKAMAVRLAAIDWLAGIVVERMVGCY